MTTATATDPSTVSFEVKLSFPLPDGRTVVQGPLTYESDGLFTTNRCDFIAEPRFREAYRLGNHTGHKFRENPDDLHIEWRVHVLCWAATQALRQEGDFVECGVNTGIFSRAIMHYVGFERFPERSFYLLDTYNGIPLEQMTPHEVALGRAAMNKRYPDCYEMVRETFKDYPNARIIRGRVPETLAQVDSDRVAFLSVDMNIKEPEIAALDHFWDRLVAGAWVVLDDYGFPGHEEQKAAFDEFAAGRGVEILSVPTGQGLLVRP